MALLPDTQKCGLRMQRKSRERFPRHCLQRKTLVSDLGMHHGTCVTHVPWCMSRSLICGGGENVPGFPGACTTHTFMYLARGPCLYLIESSDWVQIGYISANTVGCLEMMPRVLWQLGYGSYVVANLKPYDGRTIYALCKLDKVAYHNL